MREIVLAYLISEGLNTYTQVAATLQAFINDQETILALIANDDLERSLEDLREMESVKIDIDPDKEAMVPRPSASEEMQRLVDGILEDADGLLERYRGETPDKDIADALVVEEADDVTVGVDGDEDGDDASSGSGDENADGDGGEFDYGGFAFEAGGEGEPGDGATTDGGATDVDADADEDGDSDTGVDPFGGEDGDAGVDPFGGEDER